MTTVPILDLCQAWDGPSHGRVAPGAVFGQHQRMRKLLLVLFVCLLVVWFFATRGKAPDERIAAHHAALCDIAEDGISRPSAGVDKLFRFFGERGPEMAKDWAELLVLIERISDDRSHDERARQAARRIQAPLLACQKTLERFERAIENDPTAMQKLERGLERLSRTLEIIFKARVRTLDDLVRVWTLPPA